MADADTLLDAYVDLRQDQEIQARYAVAIAVWDDVHRRDRRGYLPEQALRLRQYVAAVKGGFSPEPAAFVRWLVHNGRMTR